jgi:hypothetical protein
MQLFAVSWAVGQRVLSERAHLKIGQIESNCAWVNHLFNIHIGCSQNNFSSRGMKIRREIYLGLKYHVADFLG